jgi:hypothetical protein
VRVHPAGHLIRANPIAGRCARAAIRLPQPNSPGRRPPKTRPNRIGTPFDMAAPEEGSPPPVTSRERRLPVRGRAPECVVWISMASGQQPTKPNGAGPLAINGAGFKDPTHTARRVAKTADGRVSMGTVPKAPSVATARWQYRSAEVNQLAVRIRNSFDREQGRIRVRSINISRGLTSSPTASRPVEALPLTRGSATKAITQ